MCVCVHFISLLADHPHIFSFLTPTLYVCPIEGLVEGHILPVLAFEFIHVLVLGRLVPAQCVCVYIYIYICVCVCVCVCVFVSLETLGHVYMW